MEKHPDPDDEALRKIVQLLARGVRPHIHPYVPPGSVVAIDSPAESAILFHSKAEMEALLAELAERLKEMS